MEPKKLWIGAEWQGDTRDEALEHMEKAAAEGCKCIKLEWRP